MFAGVGLGEATGNVAAAAGLLVGAARWRLILSLAAGAGRERFDRRRQQWLNRLSGAVIAGFGFWQLIKLAVR